MDYNVPAINRDFGTVFLGDKNVAVLAVSQGWVKVENRVLCAVVSQCTMLGMFY